MSLAPRMEFYPMGVIRKAFLREATGWVILRLHLHVYAGHSWLRQQLEQSRQQESNTRTMWGWDTAGTWWERVEVVGLDPG